MTANWRPKVSSIDDLIAEDWWECVLPNGETAVSHLRVSKPRQLEDGTDWYTAVQILGYSPTSVFHGPPNAEGIRLAYGVGPVDALQNASSMIARIYEGIGVAPLGGKPPADV